MLTSSFGALERNFRMGRSSEAHPESITAEVAARKVLRVNFRSFMTILSCSVRLDSEDAQYLIPIRLFGIIMDK